MPCIGAAQQIGREQRGRVSQRRGSRGEGLKYGPRGATQRWMRLMGISGQAAIDHEDAASISSMFLVTTSIVRPSSSVGLNSTTSVPAKRTGVCPGPA